MTAIPTQVFRGNNDLSLMAWNDEHFPYSTDEEQKTTPLGGVPTTSTKQKSM